MIKRLSQASLASVAAGVSLPEYNRADTGRGILHFGIGAFHRAHQAVYTELAMNRYGGDWCITGVSLRSDTVAKQLQPQDCLYSVLAEDGEGLDLRVIGAVRDVLVASDDLPGVLSAIADPAVHIISFTITEKGYCSTDSAGLDLSHPGIVADLAQPDKPATAIGILALGLSQRQAAGYGPITLLSCDNLSENGRVLRGVLYEYAEMVFPRLPVWLDSQASFPNSMVDRIVPAIDPIQKDRQSQLLGLDDQSAIGTEPFMQWIVEDDFASLRPDWERVGVTFVDDIRPYENIKLGLLNASHSAIACCGLLAGLATVDEVMADPVLGIFIRNLMTGELAPGLDVPASFDLQDYCEQLLARFANPQLKHRCEQIFTDSSVKISQRWVQHFSRPEEKSLLPLALSAWCYLVLATEVDIDDPARDALMRLRSAGEGASLAELLALARICPDTVHNFDKLCAEISRNMESIRERGLAVCVEALPCQPPLNNVIQ